MICRNQINPAQEPSPGIPAPQPVIPAPGAPAPQPAVPAPVPGMPSTGPVPAQPGLPSLEESLEGERLALYGSLRQLWTQLAVWSRALIVSVAANLGDIQAIKDRLAIIPDAFSRVLSRYFDPRDADRFRVLLIEHIAAMAALVTAEKNNDIQTVNQETENLYANAGRIAAQLAGMNPYWNQEQWGDLLNDYIEILLADLVARMEGDYSREITIFDDLEAQAIKMAEYMAQGMMQRFRP